MRISPHTNSLLWRGGENFKEIFDGGGLKYKPKNSLLSITIPIFVQRELIKTLIFLVIIGLGIVPFTIQNETKA